jgi:hypothetical protein
MVTVTVECPSNCWTVTIHAARHKTGRERVSQRMPRHTLDSRFSARQGKTRFQIDEWISGFVVVKNKFTFSAEGPVFQNSPRAC